MFNKEILKEAIECYKKDFDKSWENEKFKWEAVKAFQDNWDSDASDFAGMLDKALSKTQNLLTSVHNFPRGMIVFYAGKDPEKVRFMFKNLFDENIDLLKRFEQFKTASDELKKRYSKEKDQHFQRENPISTYLWLKYPDKYYIYKFSEVKKTSQKLESTLPVKGGAFKENLASFYSLYNEICEAIKEDSELKDMLSSHITENCYPDPELKTLTIDLCFYISSFFNVKKPPIVTSQPDDSCTVWKISHGTDSTGIAEENRNVFLDRKVVVVNGKTKSKGVSKETQGDAFKNIKKGDYFYLCFGNCVKLLGKIISDETKENPEIKNGWLEREYEIIAYSKSSEPYKDITKRWTPDNNSTCIKVDDNNLFQEKLLKPYFGMTLEEMIKKESSVSYWWLNANPKIWSLSEIAVGEEQFYTFYNENGHKRRVFQNFTDARQGDLVIGYESNPVKQIVALCRITKNDGNNLYFEKLESFANPIDYKLLKEYTELEDMEFFKNPNGSFFSLTKDEYDFITDLIREENPVKKNAANKPYSKEDFLNEVYMSEDRYELLKTVLKNKKNIILEGAPGVGKTFAAKRLAYSIMGEADNSRIEFIQFHQNYSYEDFIMGYKPSGNSFELKYGIFYNFCIKASNHPDKEYFFIIDEINRGNLSKIFGELLMLIENDYRGTKATLAYNGLAFSVPKNLYIIGMMNTADRSLALIDYALRRRFSFFDMSPAFDTDSFKKYQKSLNDKSFDVIIEKIKELNSEIEKDKSLGKGFMIGHSYFCGQEKVTPVWLRSVIEFDIIPMLSEYWFDDENKLNIWTDTLRGALK